MDVAIGVGFVFSFVFLAGFIAGCYVTMKLIARSMEDEECLLAEVAKRLRSNAVRRGG